MTALAVTVLIVWALGIVIATACLPLYLRQNPMAALPFDLNPVAACLVTAVAIAFWPGAFAAAGLNHLADRRRNR